MAQGPAVRAAILVRRARCSAVRGAYSSYNDNDDDCYCHFLNEDGGLAPPPADVKCLDVDGVAKPKDEDDTAGVDRPDENLEQTTTAAAAAAVAAAAADSRQRTADGGRLQRDNQPTNRQVEGEGLTMDGMPTMDGSVEF